MEVCEDFVRDALQSRFDEVKSRWACEATSRFWEEFLDMMVNCGVKKDDTPSIVVDNYLINSDHGPISDYIREGETTAEMLKRLSPIFYDDEYIIVSY
ncbi:MAG: hypothetical protein LBM93_15145 [Oscillospiraceae bacterium]|jgi:hypothetical protein|nr:hypothetical protein [Oscillospiraceae bacterium]